MPLFPRINWTERAGRIISSGSRPKYLDFLKFSKERASLVNNEFGEDLSLCTQKGKDGVNQRDSGSRGSQKMTSLSAGVQGQQKDPCRNNQVPLDCAVCRSQNQSHQERRRVLQERAFVSEWSLCKELSLNPLYMSGRKMP